jgi:hypothetical protein
MNPHRTMTRFLATVLVVMAYLALAVASVGCGGGNDSTTSSTAPVGIFTPDTPVPADGSVTLLQGTTSGASVNVRVTVTQVDNFFGAAFRITYDPAALLFNGMDHSTSLLNAGITDTSSQLLFIADSANSPGEIVITATRLFPATPLPAAPTADLVILNFVARLAIAPGAEVGRLDFGDPTHNQVCDGTVSPPGCGAIAVTWSGGGISAQ